MNFFEILLEGSSDVPAVRSILQRKFGLRENEDFRVHPHQGRGKLPKHPNLPPQPKHRGLLDQLPAKLRGYSGLPKGYWLIVLLDADKDKCEMLKQSLVDLYRALPRKPKRILFRIAVEETESWFLADKSAVKKAFPRVDLNRIPGPPHDQQSDAWECLAKALGRSPEECDGGDKLQWAEAISPHLDLDTPQSPSLSAFISGIERCLGQEQ